MLLDFPNILVKSLGILLQIHVKSNWRMLLDFPNILVKSPWKRWNSEILVKIHIKSYWRTFMKSMFRHLEEDPWNCFKSPSLETLEIWFGIPWRKPSAFLKKIHVLSLWRIVSKIQPMENLFNIHLESLIKALGIEYLEYSLKN